MISHAHFKSGQIVSIYEDPIQKHNLEGSGKLVNLIIREKHREYWLVKFANGDYVNRWITY